MIKRLLTLLALSVLCHSASSEDLFTPRDLAAIDDALGLMGMSQTDFGFEKDVAEPEWFFEWSKTWLHHPREFTKSSQRLLTELQNVPNPWEFIYDTFEIAPSSSSLISGPAEVTIPEKYQTLLSPFLKQIAEAEALLTMAFTPLSVEDRNRLAVSFFAGTFAAEHSPLAMQALKDAGFTETDIDRWKLAQETIDPVPEGHWTLRAGDSLDLTSLLAATKVLEDAVDALRQRTASFKHWPDTPERIDTKAGALVIGTREGDVYSDPALLILDPAGNDLYQDHAGVANGLSSQSIAVILDLDGHDRYRSDRLLGPGAALFGMVNIYDVSGDDVYESDWVGQACAAYGSSLLTEASGRDTYRAHGFGQAAGHVGLGLLKDLSGNDLYDIGFAGQGFAGFKGLGLLVDRAGNDVYKAGGVRPDYERHDDRYLSMAQGFAIGARPWAGGGRGVLVDFQGDDRYIADIYGQGVGYWYSAGMLLDLEGNDQYQMFQYGQGAGIHLSLGLLADLAGRDQYTGYVLTQGAAHDYAVGIMIEGGGDDTYVADHFSQGRAMNNSLAILLDRGGQDGYFSRQCDRSQGIGNNADLRDYGSLALILDLAGKDQYSCGAIDNESQFRPDFGQIYDREVKHEE